MCCVEVCVCVTPWANVVVVHRKRSPVKRLIELARVGHRLPVGSVNLLRSVPDTVASPSEANSMNQQMQGEIFKQSCVKMDSGYFLSEVPHTRRDDGMAYEKLQIDDAHAALTRAETSTGGLAQLSGICGRVTEARLRAARRAHR